jgi:hypothetical protein
MARNEDALDAYINPSGREIWQRNTPIFLPLADMRFVRKLIDPIKLIEVPLEVLACMFKCDSKVEMKEGWEKRVRTILSCRSDGRRRNRLAL